MARKHLTKKLLRLREAFDLPPILLLPSMPSWLPGVGNCSFFTNVLNLFGIIHVMSDCESKAERKDHLVHEVGHAHLSRYFGDVIDENEFEELFGSYHQKYRLKHWRRRVDPNDPEFVSDYAQAHPQEDYAECFIHALEEVETETTYTYGNRKLNKKIRAVKRWINETLA